MSGSLGDGPEHSLSMEFQLKDAKYASILKATLDANPELKPSIITRETSVLDGAIFRIHFKAKDPRMLRVASSSILEIVETVLETMDMFPPPPSDK